MRTYAFCVFLILIFASGRCCSVAITQPTHLSATVSLEFFVAVAQPSKLSVSIDGSDVFNGNVSGDFNFALQARFPVLYASPVPVPSFILLQELWSGTHSLHVSATCDGTSTPSIHIHIRK